MASIMLVAGGYVGEDLICAVGIRWVALAAIAAMEDAKVGLIDVVVVIKVGGTSRRIYDRQDGPGCKTWKPLITITL